MILFVFSLCRFNYFNDYQIDEITNEFTVIESYEKYVILKNDNSKYIFYDENLDIGNKVIIKGEAIKLELDSNFNKYLNSQKIYYQVTGKVIYNDNHLSLNERIIELLLSNKDIENRPILKLILFNQKDSSNDAFYNYFSMFSLNFLIVISGFHINLIFKILDKSKFIKYIFNLVYLYLLNLSVSSLKSFIYYCLKKVNKKLDLVFNNIDLLSFIFIALVFINPSYCFNLGFIYTFVFSFSIEIINSVINSNKKSDKLIKKILIFFISLPLILMNNYEVNSMALILTMIFEFPVSILFIFSLLYLFFDKFYLLYKLYIKIISFLLENISGLSSFIIFGKPSIYVVILLYLSILFFLYLYQNKFKYISYLTLIGYGLILCFQYYIPVIDDREMIHFLDVGQGDCSVLKVKHSKSVVLIDTGGSEYRDIANDVIIPFLKEKGIEKIEKVIITHDDFDHNGALEQLNKNFLVEEIIDDSMIEKIEIGESRFINLNVNHNRDNDGSIVLYGKYGGINYLFSGDISKRVEGNINEHYKLDVDVLKVSHHGSNSSTSEAFIESINPSVALIGVGRNNKYKHPHEEVLETLNSYNINIYRTDINGNITLYKSKYQNIIIVEKEKD